MYIKMYKFTKRFGVSNVNLYKNLKKMSCYFFHSLIHVLTCTGSVRVKASLDLDFSLSWSWSWSWAMYKLYGTSTFVPGLDLGTSGLELSSWATCTKAMGLLVLCLVLISAPLVLSSGLELAYTCTKSMGLLVLCLVLISAPLVLSYTYMYKVYGTSGFVPGLDLGTSGLELSSWAIRTCTKSMGLRVLCLVLISAPLVLSAGLELQCTKAMGLPVLCLVLSSRLELYVHVQSLWDFWFCAWSWSRHLWSWALVLSYTYMYKVYGTSGFVPGLDLGTSGLELSSWAIRTCTKSMGLRVLCLVLISAPLVLSSGLELYVHVQSLWDFGFCAWSWSRHLWSWALVLSYTYMYKVYGTLGFVPGLDLGTSGLELSSWAIRTCTKSMGLRVLCLVLISAPLVFSVGLELCTKAMGLPVLCLVLISAPVVSTPTLLAGTCSFDLNFLTSLNYIVGL